MTLFNFKNVTILQAKTQILNTGTKSTILWQSFIQILTYNAIVGATQRTDNQLLQVF
jgi:hypothetical protein